MIPDDHFRNVPVGALSPSIQMQQKQQQNLKNNRKSSLTNASSPSTTNLSNKQHRSNSFWNPFGIGNKQDDSSDNATNVSEADHTPSISSYIKPGHCANIGTNASNEPYVGMAPR